VPASAGSDLRQRPSADRSAASAEVSLDAIVAGEDADVVDAVPDEPQPAARRASATPASASPISPRSGRN
jgi:hypothetical protein